MKHHLQPQVLATYCDKPTVKKLMPFAELTKPIATARLDSNQKLGATLDISRRKDMPLPEKVLIIKIQHNICRDKDNYFLYDIPYKWRYGKNEN